MNMSEIFSISLFILILFLIGFIINFFVAFIISLFKKDKIKFFKIYAKFIGVNSLIIPLIIILIILGFFNLITFGIGISILVMFYSLLSYFFSKSYYDFYKETSINKMYFDETFYKIAGAIFFIIGLIILILSIIYKI